MPRGKCKDCDMKSVSRGYCRRHYNQRLEAGDFDDKPAKTGRPRGASLAADPPAGWWAGEDVPVSELKKLVRIWAWHILTDPGAMVVERTAAARIISQMPEDGVDEGRMKKLQELMQATRLRPVPDEASSS